MYVLTLFNDDTLFQEMTDFHYVTQFVYLLVTLLLWEGNHFIHEL